MIAEHFGTTVAALRGPSRVRELAFARHMAMYLLRHPQRGFAPSLKEIGGVLGERDHKTVFVGVRRIEREINVYDGVAEMVNELARKIREVR